jgi:hypothetical protein
MNNYHKNHPDPEVRQKYAEWEKAYYASSATGSGYNSRDEHQAAMAKEKEKRRSVARMLQSLGGQAVKGSKFGIKTSTKQAKKQARTMQRTGGQRGS